MKSIIATTVATLAINSNCLEIEAGTEVQLLPPWDFSLYPHYAEATEERCDQLPAPLLGNPNYGTYIYHTPGCFCIWDAAKLIVDYCDANGGKVPNPLYEGEAVVPPDAYHDIICVTPAEAD